MKRIFYTLAALVLTVSMVEAGVKKGGPTGGGGAIGGAKQVTSPGKPKVTDSVTQTVGKKVDLGGKTQVLNKKLGDPNKTIGNKVGQVGIQGNKSVAKMPGFKSNPQMHTQFCAKYRVPGHLHGHCLFHHDFCWNHHCWFPNYGCCGYWHPHARCWYYWSQPYCCYLPYSCIETYAPVAVVQPAAINVNVNNSNTNVDSDAPPMLPLGASLALPPGVNPNIPAPKQ